MKKSLQSKLILLPTIYYLLSTLLCGCQKQNLYTETRIMMGTFVEVKSTDERAARIAFEEIKRIEELFSKYKEDSEVSKLNKLGELNVSPDVMYLVKKAKEFWLASNGAFDITVGPLMDLWGFSDKKYFLPSPADIAKTLEVVGFDKVVINESDNSVKFKVPGMKLDLGAIAKGYAVDCAVKKLKENGIKSCLINAGGDLYCLGRKSAKPWSIAIQNPRKDEILRPPRFVRGPQDEQSESQKDFSTVQLTDMAVATSGDYEQFFIKDGKRYSHIFNPKTGMPVDSGVVSVTVVASDCLTADAIATTVSVLGKKEGEALAKKYANVKVEIK